MERKLTENPDNMVNIEEEMAFDELSITGNYSDDDILEGGKKLYPKMAKFGSKLKNIYGEGE